MQPLAEK